MTSAAYDRLAAGYYNPDLKTLANPGGLSGPGAVRANWAPMLLDFVTVAGEVSNSAAVVATALGGANSVATSATNTSIPAVGGTMTINIGAGKTVVPGQRASIARPPPNATTSVAYGTIAAYDSGTGILDLLVEDRVVTSGAGPFSSWNFGLSGYGVPQSRTLTAAGLATGGGDWTANRTITVPAAAASDVHTGTDTTKAVTSGALAGAAAFATLTDAATVAWDVTNGFNATVTLGGNRTIGAPTNLKDGVTYTLNLVQDGTGSRVPTWNSIWDFGREGTPVLQTAAGKTDKVIAQYNSTRNKLEASFWKGV